MRANYSTYLRHRVHFRHLVRDGLHVAFEGLDAADHHGQLVADDGLVDEALGEHLPLRGPQVALLEDHADACQCLRQK